MKTRYIRLFLIFIIVLFAVHPALAAENAEDVIVVGVADDDVLITDRVLYTAFKKIGKNIVIRRLPSEIDAMYMLESGSVDVLAAYPEVAEASSNILRVPVSLLNLEARVYSKEGSSPEVKDFSELSNYERVAYTQNSLDLEALIPASCISIDKQGTGQLFEALISGEADIALAAVPEMLHIAVPEGLKESPPAAVFPLYTYMDYSKASLFPELTRIYEEIRQNGTLEKLKAQQPLEESAGRKVLHISSYDSDNRWDSNLVKGIQEEFSKDTNISYYNFSLDIGRIDYIENQKLALREMISSSFLQSRPDLVIASDNEALNFVRENYFKLFPGVPLIYCGINGFDKSMIYGLEEYSAGVPEGISAGETISEMLELYPDTKRIYIVNDHTNMGKLWKQAISEQAAAFADRVSIEYNEEASYQELIDTVAAFDYDTLVLYGDYYRDSANVNIEESSFGFALSEASKQPVFGLMDAHVGIGMLGGKVISRYGQGLKIAQVSKEILAGADITDPAISQRLQDVNEWIIDYSVAEKYRLNLAALPEHIAVNKKLSIYETNPVETAIFICIICATALLAAVLSFFITKLRKRNKELLDVQNKLHTSEEMLKKDLELTEVKGRLEHIIDMAPFAYSLSLDGEILQINNYLREIIAYTEGDTVSSYYENPNHRLEIVERLKHQTKITGEIVKIKMRDGRVSRFILNASNVRYEGRTVQAAWAVEIEELEKQKDALRSAEAGLKKIMDTLPIPMMMLIPKSQEIIYENQAFSALFRQDKLRVGKNLTDIGLSEMYSRYVENFAQNRAAEIGSSFEYAYTESGESVDLLIHSSEIKYRGRKTAIFICQNISEQKKQEELLLRAAEKEREANQLKSIFLANMSHEIRTPMNAVLGLSQVALMKQQSKENNDLFRKIHSSASNLLAIINDILDFSKIEAEKMDLVEEEFRLEEVITNAFMVAMERLEGKHIEMMLRLNPDVPCYLYGDKTRLWQILKNLLDNSAKYTDEGHIILRVRVDEAKTNNEIAALIFEISDTGIGMSIEQQARLFTPFEQFNNNEFKNKKSGTGLGMSITKQLVDLQNGSIAVTSEPGIGSTIKVEISFKRSETTTDVRQMIAAMLNTCKDLLDPVLIVDDDRYSLMGMSELFSVGDVEAVCVKTENEAIEKIREYNQMGNPFKLVLIDYMLGKDNGLNTGRRVRSLNPEAKMIMVTAYSSRLFTETDAKEAGFLDVIEKPFVASSFIKKICEITEGKIEFTQAVYPDYSSSRVLLCEDNLINQQVAVSMLEVFGITPKIANNGKEALEWLEKEPFDLIFMDIIMPVMDGHEATERIRKSQASYKDITIIAMTANVMSDEVERFIAGGMDGYIEKPIDFANLQENLQRFLGHSSVKMMKVSEDEAKDGILKVEGIETTQGLLRFGGKRERYEKALRHFAQNIGESLLPFTDYTSEDSKKRSAAILHTLKGVSGNLGIVGLHGLIIDFEKSLRKNEPDYALYSRVNELCIEISARILSDLPEKEESSEELPKGSREEFIVGLRMLEGFLDRADISKCEEVLGNMKGKSWNSTAAAMLKEIEEKTMDYEFDEALEMIRERRGEI